MMGTETVPETLDFNELTRLSAREEFINFSRRESFTSYSHLHTRRYENLKSRLTVINKKKLAKIKTYSHRMRSVNTL
jgi:hypothetical protein